jgi:hypothetical protein
VKFPTLTKPSFGAIVVKITSGLELISSVPFSRYSSASSFFSYSVKVSSLI